MDRQTRQAKLQQRLAALHQRRWQQSTQDLLDQLQISPQECSIFPADHDSVKDHLQWLQRSFPWQWSQIDWAKVPQSQCYLWNSQESQTKAFAELCQVIQTNHLSQNPGHDPVVAVIWFNANAPVLELPWTVAQRAIAAIVEQDSDIWIIERQAEWCIECHHEGTMCYGCSQTES